MKKGKLIVTGALALGFVLASCHDGNMSEAEWEASNLATKLGGGVEVNGTTVTVTDAEKKISGKVAIPEGVTLEIPNGKAVTVASGATVTVDGAVAVDGGAKLDVASGATLDVEKGGSLTLGDGSSGALKGTIEVKGTLIDLAEDGGSLWGDGAVGEYVLHAGAKAYMVDEKDGDLFVFGPSGSEAIVALTSGTFTLRKTGYELNGNATIQQNFGTNLTLVIKPGAILAGTGSVNLAVAGTVTVQGASNFYSSDSATEEPTSTPVAGTYQWSANKNGWVKGS